MVSKFKIFGIILAVWLASGLILGQNPAGAASERIRTFASNIIVHPDASLTVTEKITVVSAGQEIKRGIVRDFPTSYQDRYGNRVKVGFQILEILRDGQPETYHVEKVANGVKIFIGQKDVFLPPGQYTYTIKYATTRQLGHFKDFDELYWNVTGNGWTFAIDLAQAVVQLPAGATVKQYAAYTGPFGAQGQDFRFSQDRAGNLVFTTTRGLAPYEGLTIAVAWPKGLVREPTEVEKGWSFFKDNVSLLGAILGFLVLLGYYLYIWSGVGRDPAKGTIIPRFEPPPGFSPAAVRYLMRMGFDDKTFGAAVMNLAVQGYLRIREADGSFTLEKKREDGNLFPEEKSLGRNLFGTREVLNIGQENQKILADAQETLEKSLQKALDTIYFKTNRKYVWPAVLITLMMLATLIVTAEDRGAAAGIMLFYVITCIMLGVFYAFWQNTNLITRIFFLIFGSFWFFSTVILTPAAAFGSIWVSAALGGVIFLHLLFVQLLKAPTLLGRQIMDQIEGFKMYLGVAEQDRLALLHPPAKTPELFERYLPYALALGVENEWSEQFAEVLAQAAVAGKAYSPSWYTGRSWDAGRSANFATSLGRSLSASIASAATPPSSSSGSGGGGSSGGGGGGGGGSGW